MKGKDCLYVIAVLFIFTFLTLVFTGCGKESDDVDYMTDPIYGYSDWVLHVEQKNGDVSFASWTSKGHNAVLIIQAVNDDPKNNIQRIGYEDFDDFVVEVYEDEGCTINAAFYFFDKEFGLTNDTVKECEDAARRAYAERYFKQGLRDIFKGGAEQ